MGWIVEDLDPKIGDGVTPLAFYEENRNDEEPGKTEILGLCIDDWAGRPSTVFPTERAAMNAINHTNDWFERDSGYAPFTDCRVRKTEQK